jgi:hypothetical protein
MVDVRISYVRCEAILGPTMFFYSMVMFFMWLRLGNQIFQIKYKIATLNKLTYVRQPELNRAVIYIQNRWRVIASAVLAWNQERLLASLAIYAVFLPHELNAKVYTSRQFSKGKFTFDPMASFPGFTRLHMKWWTLYPLYFLHKFVSRSSFKTNHKLILKLCARNMSK